MQQTALAIFLAIYVLLLICPRFRAQIALLGAIIFVIMGIVPPGMIVQMIDWNVIFMIAGTMGIVSMFIHSRMPELLADLIIAKTPTIRWAIVALALFSGLISAFIDNVATVLIVAPIAISISEKQGISPVTSVIAVAISSNLQGAATLVGDATSILLGGYAGLDFFDFFFFKGKPGLFWIVQAAAVVATAVLYLVLRRERRKVKPQKKTEVTDYFPSLLLGAMVLFLILASFLAQKPPITNGLICLGLMGLGLLRTLFVGEGVKGLKRVISEIDVFTLALLAGLFIVIGGLTRVGVIETISSLIADLGKGKIFRIYGLIVWVSVLISGFVDNIPYVLAMLPVMEGTAQLMGSEPNLLYFGLLIGATLGGNLTPIGASANITALGLLRRRGYQVGAGEFMKISVPFTLAAVCTGYLLVWLLWGGAV